MLLVRKLLDMIMPSDGKVTANPTEVMDALLQVESYFSSAVNTYAKKSTSSEYLAQQCFIRKDFLTDSEFEGYCRSNLRLATLYFGKLLRAVEKSFSVGGPIENYFRLLADYMFDISYFVDHFEQKKDPEFELFSGFKSSYNFASRIYGLSKVLYSASLHHNNALSDYHREGITASVFVLRQALEKRFERAINVDIYDENYKAPRLQHGFHYDFMHKNVDLFDFNNIKFEELRCLYDWCSRLVHSAELPFVWTLPFAYDLCDSLFYGGDLSHLGGWSLHGGVRVLGFEEMQDRYIRYFFENNSDGERWCIIRRDPEAVDFNKYK